MSSVSTVIIQSSENGLRLDSRINELNRYLKDAGHLGMPFAPIDTKQSAGTKYPERTILIAGLNYLNVNEFIELFKHLDFDDGLLTIANSDHDLYRVISNKTTVDIND